MGRLLRTDLGTKRIQQRKSMLKHFLKECDPCFCKKMEHRTEFQMGTQEDEALKTDNCARRGGPQWPSKE